MKLNIKTIEKPIIDILVAVAARGGGENCINMLGKYLCSKGCRVRVVQMIYEGTDWAEPCLEFHYVYPSRKDHELKDFIKGYADFIKENGKPDMTLATAWPMMSYVAKRAGEEAGLSFTVASWLHAPLKMYDESGFGGGDFVKNADIHFAISNEIAGEIRSYDKEGIIYRINNPGDLSKVHRVDALKKGSLLFVGRLSEEKNIGIILCAIALAKSDWKLNLVGEGDEKEKLKKLARELNVEKKINFIGWSDDPWKYAKDSYALVLSSMYEGSPLVVIEALSCGIPVIGNVSSRVSEIVKPGQNGYIYEDNDASGFAKILDLIAAGSFPAISPDKCRESVADYREDISLFDFYCKIHATINQRLIKQSVWGVGNRAIITDTVSVIVPCFNVEKYVGRCLDSILDQTIGLNRIEIIVINDCSGDRTLNILKDYEERYSDNICVVDCEVNVGPGKARNIGLQYASGDYVFFADADDCIRDDLLETMILADKLYPSDVVSCDFQVFDGKIPEKDNISGSCYRVIDNIQERKQLLIDNSMLHPVWGKLYRTKFFRDNPDICFPEGHVMEDIYFTYVAVMHASTWQNLDVKGYNYCQNDGGTMNSEGRKKYYMDVFNMFVLSVDKYKEMGLFEPMLQELGYIYYRKVYDNIIPFIEGTFDELPVDDVKTVIGYMFATFPGIEKNVYMTEEDCIELEKAKMLLS